MLPDFLFCLTSDLFMNLQKWNILGLNGCMVAVSLSVSQCWLVYIFLHISLLMRWIQQNKFYKKKIRNLIKDWTQIACFAVIHSNHDIRKFSMLVWDCKWIIIHAWVILFYCVIHLIRWKSFHRFYYRKWLMNSKLYCSTNTWVPRLLPAVCPIDMLPCSYEKQFDLTAKSQCTVLPASMYTTPGELERFTSNHSILETH